MTSLLTTWICRDRQQDPTEEDPEEEEAEAEVEEDDFDW